MHTIESNQYEQLGFCYHQPWRLPLCIFVLLQVVQLCYDLMGCTKVQNPWVCHYLIISDIVCLSVKVIVRSRVAYTRNVTRHVAQLVPNNIVGTLGAPLKLSIEEVIEPPLLIVTTGVGDRLVVIVLIVARCGSWRTSFVEERFCDQ